MAYFHGPWFVTPREIQQTHQQSGQLFFRQEAMISTIQDTNPLLSVVGLCCILEMDDYIKSRYITITLKEKDLDPLLCF